MRASSTPIVTRPSLSLVLQDYIDSTDDGDLITAYMPVMDDKGEHVEVVVGCDYDASGVVNNTCLRIRQVGGNDTCASI